MGVASDTHASQHSSVSKDCLGNELDVWARRTSAIRFQEPERREAALRLPIGQGLGQAVDPGLSLGLRSPLQSQRRSGMCQSGCGQELASPVFQVVIGQHAQCLSFLPRPQVIEFVRIP